MNALSHVPLTRNSRHTSGHYCAMEYLRLLLPLSLLTTASYWKRFLLAAMLALVLRKVILGRQAMSYVQECYSQVSYEKVVSPSI